MKNVYIIAKPKCATNAVFEFVEDACKQLDMSMDKIITGDLTTEDVAKIYSDHVTDDFYPDLEKYMMSDTVDIYVCSVDFAWNKWEELTKMKKQFRKDMGCKKDTSENHIHIAEDWKMNNQIEDVVRNAR